MEINEIVKIVHETAKEKGWWDEARSTPECIALIHSELSEALEEYRTHGDEIEKSHYENGNKPEGIVIELADCIIRIADLCGARGWDLENAVFTKMRFNQTRTYRHGNKKA